MKKEDYIKLEQAAKEWLDATDDYQFETWELLAMFAASGIKKSEK